MVLQLSTEFESAMGPKEGGFPWNCKRLFRGHRRSTDCPNLSILFWTPARALLP